MSEIESPTIDKLIIVINKLTEGVKLQCVRAHGAESERDAALNSLLHSERKNSELQARAEKAEADAERLAEALKFQEFDDNCWCSPEWKEHSVSDYGRIHSPCCIKARDALAAHDTKDGSQ